jgi:methylmalonyl-CoA/ethylmalonyl-CoA epimerase
MDTFKKLEHIGIAVKDATQSIKLFSALLGTSPYLEEEVASENVRTVFYKVGETKLELLECLSADGTIARFIEKRGEGIHHLAFDVEDIHASIERLKKEGFQFISDIPKRGAENKLVVFLHPKSGNGILIELCQDI